MISSAKTLGFSPDAEIRDKSQMAFLSALMREGANRYILKGGMAMRALYGSARLTKDVDFDCEDSVSPQSMAARIPKALDQAARRAGIVHPKVVQTKTGDLSGKWRLVGATQAGPGVSWDVEISRRGIPPSQYIDTQTIQPPFDYALAPFIARVYSETATVASKISALLSERRNVPRDIYDLYDLVNRGANPVPLWIEAVPRETLERKGKAVLPKIAGIDFALASTELLPYIARDLRATIDAKRWDEMCMVVAEAVDGWLREAIPKAKPAKELDRDESIDVDLAGR
jgi:predicted nucleotidyltransferase component of viral defense system